MKPLPHHYDVHLTGGPAGYAQLSTAGIPELRTAPPTDYDGPGDAWSPEHLLLASVQACFLFTLRAIARLSKVEFLALELGGDTGDAMIEIRRILCPIDFSDYSRRALDHAVAVARRYESRVTVLHVFPTAPVAAYGPGPPGFESIVLTRADRDQLLVEMKRFIEAESAPGVSVEAMIQDGNVASEILNQATATKADLLVIGTHGRSGFERLLLGSVTEKVLRKATCPVLSVPRRLPDAVPATPVLFKQILCPVDFSDCSMNALNYAMSLAQEADAHLTVLHVVMAYEDPLDMADTLASDERLSLAAYRRQWADNARQRLKDAVPDTVAEYCSVETMVSSGKPGLEILRIAAEQRSDLIVIGIQGRGAADLMFFGSTTQQVVRQATCPVLTLRRDRPPA